MMMPIRALMLTGVAAVTGIITTLGIGFNAAIILGVMQALRAGG